MATRFEKVSRFADIDLPMPTRATQGSAGYDLAVAEDIVIPPIDFFMDKIRFNIPENRFKSEDYYGFINPITFDEIEKITKELKAKIPLVSTGMKCEMEPGYYLEIMARSSLPFKHWLVVANAEGIIDCDYYNNESNEGEIFFQIINLSPFAIQLKRGDKIGQGIIKKFITTDDDSSIGKRIGGLGSTSE